MYLAFRRQVPYSELRFLDLNIDDEDGIQLEIELETYSHASMLNAKAHLSISGTTYRLMMEPVKSPINSHVSIANVYHMVFFGKYVPRGAPKKADVRVWARFNDGSRAKLHKKITLNSSDSDK